MDEYLVQIKALEQRIVDYLQIYKKCRTREERQEVQNLIEECDKWLQRIRDSAPRD